MSIKVKKEFKIIFPGNDDTAILLGEESRIVTMEVTLYCVHDSKMDCDADGNRGYDCWYVDDVDYKMPTECDDGIPLLSDDVLKIQLLLDKQVHAMSSYDVSHEVRNYYEE